MAKKIVAIGIDVAAKDVAHEGFSSKVSLLDFDIAIFRPDLPGYLFSGGDSYLGKPCLNDSMSFHLKESAEHWRREIKQAIGAGKTVIVFLPPLEEVYAATGEKQHSGTGRNRSTTRIVDKYSNYKCLPVSLNPVNAKGTSIKSHGKLADCIAPIWSEFGPQFEYEVILTAESLPTCLVTRAGDKSVGAVFQSASSSGALVLLPDLNFCNEKFSKQTDNGEVWTKEGQAFSSRLLAAIVAVDACLREASESTAEPAWAQSEAYALANEPELRSALLAAEKDVEEAQRRKEFAMESLAAAGKLRRLLFEKGKPLEAAIIDALTALGFSADGYKHGESEFDVVFECEEGRLIGEAEGKDSKAINVDKLRQLMMNVQEDLQREEVERPAKGVLFGNAHRLLPVESREDFFTQKCISSAETMSVALVTTTDLFRAAQYVIRSGDEAYARFCRTTLLSNSGLVKFASPPPLVDTAVSVSAGDT